MLGWEGKIAVDAKEQNFSYTELDLSLILFTQKPHY